MQLAGDFNTAVSKRGLERAGGYGPPELLDRSPPGADPLAVVVATRSDEILPGIP